MKFTDALKELEAKATEGSGLHWQWKLALLDRNTKEIINLVEAAEQVDREFHQNNTSSLRKCEIDALFKLHNTLAALNKEQQ